MGTRIVRLAASLIAVFVLVFLLAACSGQGVPSADVQKTSDAAVAQALNIQGATLTAQAPVQPQPSATPSPTASLVPTSQVEIVSTQFVEPTATEVPQATPTRRVLPAQATATQAALNPPAATQAAPQNSPTQTGNTGAQGQTGGQPATGNLIAGPGNPGDIYQPSTRSGESEWWVIGQRRAGVHSQMGAILEDAKGDVGKAIAAFEKQYSFRGIWHWSAEHAVAGIPVQGPAYAAFDSLLNPVPDGFEQLTGVGNWGIYYLPEGKESLIKFPAGHQAGGSLLLALPKDHPVEVFAEKVKGMTPQEANELFAAEYGHLPGFVNFETGMTQRLWENEIAVCGIDHGGAPMLGGSTLVEGVSDYGYGLFLYTYIHPWDMSVPHGGCISFPLFP